jgi:hypothetical protein
MKIDAKLSLALGLLALCAGCSKGAGPADGDMATTEDQDLRRMAADMGGRCELPFDQRAIDQVSDGMISVMENAGVYTAQVDGTAGGANGFQSRPFIYLDLIGGKKVAITDVQARDSKDWDIAFKRWQIKINSGDSGPGGVTTAVVKGKELPDVSAAPASGYVEDDYLDPDCMVVLDSIGGLATAMSDWYEYNNMKLAPRKDTYVLKRRDGMGSIKLQVTGYYDPSDATRSAVYTIRWGLLP